MEDVNYNKNNTLLKGPTSLIHKQAIGTIGADFPAIRIKSDFPSGRVLVHARAPLFGYPLSYYNTSLTCVMQ